jgi:NADH:ubiquinone oxidoreductase subunit C
MTLISSSTQTNSPVNPVFSTARLARISRLVPATLTRRSQGERRVKTDRNTLIPLLTVLKSHTGRDFSQLRDITAVDRPERKLRYEVVYSLLSLSTAQRITVLVSVAEGDSIPSVTNLYPSAG